MPIFWRRPGVADPSYEATGVADLGYSLQSGASLYPG